MDSEVFFHFIQSPGDHLSDDLISTLEKCKLVGLAPEQCSTSFKRQWLLNQAYLDEIHNFSKDCPPATLLKGAHLLLEKVYDHPGKRFMGDVDLLINKDEQPNWKLFLESKGYRDITKDSWEANDFKRIFLKSDRGLELVIELHTRLFFQESSNFSWQTKASKLSAFSTLTNEDLFIHLCGHLAYQHTFISLHWLYDIFLLVQKETLNWSIIKERAKEAQVLRSCELVLWCLENHFDWQGDHSLKMGVPLKSLAKVFLTKDFLIDPNHSTLHYQAVKHLTKDHLHQALNYDLLWLKARFNKEKA